MAFKKKLSRSSVNHFTLQVEKFDSKTGIVVDCNG